LPGKEIKMNKNRFFNLLVIVALAIMAALTINQVAAADRISSAASNGAASLSSQAGHLTSGFCAAPEASRSAIQTVYVERSGSWMPTINGVPTGVEGGLGQVLNDRRSCSN
jgi:hypothetical protein